MKSNELQGAAFTLALPLEYYRSQPQKSPDEEEHAETESETTPTGAATGALPQADFSGQTVMLVEENVEMLLQLTYILSQWGINVIAATDEDEIREVLREEPQCLLVIINSHVCDTNNCDSISVIHNEKISGNIIALAEDCSRMNAELKRAAADCLAIPINAEQLKSIIDDSLKQ